MLPQKQQHEQQQNNDFPAYNVESCDTNKIWMGISIYCRNKNYKCVCFTLLKWHHAVAVEKERRFFVDNLISCPQRIFVVSLLHTLVYADKFLTPPRPVEKPFRCCIADIFKGKSMLGFRYVTYLWLFKSVAVLSHWFGRCWHWNMHNREDRVRACSSGRKSSTSPC